MLKKKKKILSFAFCVLSPSGVSRLFVRFELWTFPQSTYLHLDQCQANKFLPTITLVVLVLATSRAITVVKGYFFTSTIA